MLSIFKTTVRVSVLVFAVLGTPFLLCAEDPPRVVHTLETPTGVHFGIWGEKPHAPAPTLVILASTIEGTLGDPYFRRAGNILAEQGYLCVSIDLPCHGTQQLGGEPPQLEGWRRR